MARKSSVPEDNTPLDLSAELVGLMKDTNAHLVSDTSAAVMHDRAKIETPLYHLNCILGGGLPMGIIVEAYGEPASGKSSTWYQTMGNFQKQYPNGVSIIIDTEASVDSTRMPFMGCDPSKTLRIPADSIESGFDQLFAILDKKVQNPKLKELPVFIIWDTIGIGVTEKQLETSDQFAGGMLEKAKTIKFYLSALLPRIEEQPIAVVLLNQVTTKMTRFGSSLTSGGGWGLKHNAHLRLCYDGGKTDFDGIYATTKHSAVSMDKSKISPLFNDLSVVIDITKGGAVDPIKTFVEYSCEQLHYISDGSWKNMDPVCERHPEFIGKFDKFIDPEKSFRYDELVEYCEARPKLVYVMMLCFIEEIMEKYSYQAEICSAYHDKIIEMINAPEPYDDGTGKVIDLWTGEIISEGTSTSTDSSSEEFSTELVETPSTNDTAMIPDKNSSESPTNSEV